MLVALEPTTSPRVLMPKANVLPPPSEPRDWMVQGLGGGGGGGGGRVCTRTASAAGASVSTASSKKRARRGRGARRVMGGGHWERSLVLTPGAFHACRIPPSPPRLRSPLQVGHQRLPEHSCVVIQS